jgi:tetratricopeptide (TPR) repeat protein
MAAYEEAIEEPKFIASLIYWAKVVAQAGDQKRLERALAIIQRLRDERNKAEALEALGYSMVQAGNKEGLHRLQQIAESIYTDWLKASALAALAQAMVQAGDGEAARGAAQKALETSIVTGEEAAKAYVLGLVIEPLVQIRDIIGLEQALSAAEDIQYEPAKAYALGKVAIALAQVGKVEAAKRAVLYALKLTDSIENIERKMQSLGNIAQVLAELGDKEATQMVTEKAWRTFHDMSQPISEDPLTPGSVIMPSYTTAQKVQALNVLIQGLTQAGDREGLVTALSYGVEYSKNMRGAVVRGLVQLRDFENALIIAKEIENDQEKARALEVIARALIQKGNPVSYQEALQILESIPIIEQKAHFLSNLSSIFEQFGDPLLAQSTWRKALKSGCSFGKSTYFQILSEGILHLSDLQRKETLEEIYQVIEEAENWYVLE